MGLFDLFKTKWTSKNMTGEDRQKMCWYLKRKTSYTAWKREADAFDRFADIFERQVIEEPTPKPEMTVWGMEWDSSYPEILKAQVLYEQALSQLRQGDRSVFLYSSLQQMYEALDVARSWYSNLVDHGPRGDYFFDGKYVDAMIEAIVDFFEVSHDAGYHQYDLTGEVAPEVWSATGQKKLSQICFPEVLPVVPTPARELLIRTGQPVPVCGIYEPLTTDGCMNYLLANVAMAPKLCGIGFFSEYPTLVNWRLIWEDTRYRDGIIPADELDYFVQS